MAHGEAWGKETQSLREGSQGQPPEEEDGQLMQRRLAFTGVQD